MIKLFRFDCFAIVGAITVSNCPVSPVKDNTSGSPVSVTWTTPTASASSGDSVTPYNPTHASGSTFSVGETNVEYYWSSGLNYANCIFTVQVTLITPGKITTALF